MKKVTILLTKYSDRISSLIYYLTGKGYTHASLGIDDAYYSFDYNGFRTETVELHRRRGVKYSISCELAVTEKAYQCIRRQLQDFILHREQFHYSRLGVVFCLLHIPFRREKYYFCSQFVAELLKGSDAVPLQKRAELYLPNHFLQELRFSSQLESLHFDPI